MLRYSASAADAPVTLMKMLTLTSVLSKPVHSRVKLNPASHITYSVIVFQIVSTSPVALWTLLKFPAPRITVISLELWRFINYITYSFTYQVDEANNYSVIRVINLLSSIRHTINIRHTAPRVGFGGPCVLSL